MDSASIPVCASCSRAAKVRRARLSAQSSAPDDLQDVARRLDDDPPTGREGVDEHVGDVHLLAQHRAEPLRPDADHGTGFSDPGRQEHGLTGEQAQLTGEVTRPPGVDDQLRLGHGGVPDDVDGRRLEQEQVIAAVAGAVEHLSRLDLLAAAVRRQPAALLVAEPRRRGDRHGARP